MKTGDTVLFNPPLVIGQECKIVETYVGPRGQRLVSIEGVDGRLPAAWFEPECPTGCAHLIENDLADGDRL